MNRQKNMLCGGALCVLVAVVYLLASLTMPALFAEIEPTDCDRLGLEERRGRFCVHFPLNGPPVFQTYVMGIDSFSQYLHIRAVPLKAKSDRKLLINKNVSFTVVLEEVTDDFLVTRQTHLLQNQTAPVTCDFTDLTTEACSKFTLVLKPQIDPGNYRISFSLQKLDDLRSFISAVELEGVEIDPEYYTRYVALRYVFFAISMLLALSYVYRFLRTPDSLKVFEQYYMVVLAFALCLFNDPLLYLNVLLPNKYSLLISVLCNVSYIAALFLFWAVLFPRISLENEVPRTSQLQLWKVVYMGVFAVFFTVAFTAVAWAYMDNPASNTPKKPAVYFAFFAIGAVMVSLVLLYLGFYAYTVVRHWRTRLQRHKTVFVYSAIFALVIAGMLYSGLYRYAGFEEVDILVAVFITNLYGYLLLWLYSPGRVGKLEIERARSLGRNYATELMPAEELAIFRQELFHAPEEQLGPAPVRATRLAGPDDKRPAAEGRLPRRESSDEEESEKSAH